MARTGYIDDQGVGHIPLTQGKWALVDAHNFHWLSQWNWNAYQASNNRWYAHRVIRLPNGKQTTQAMARLIMGVTDPKINVDHVRREDTLDNRKENLRLATTAQNGRNQGLATHNESGFKGASRMGGKWRSQIQFNGKVIYLGLFDTAIQAAAVYNFAARRLHGEFAVLNDLSQSNKAGA